MSSTATLEEIGRLAGRRQALWGKLMLTPEEKAEIGRLTTELEGLWEQHAWSWPGRSQRWGGGFPRRFRKRGGVRPPDPPPGRRGPHRFLGLIGK